MSKKIFYTYLTFCTFSSWLALSSWLRLPVVLVLLFILTSAVPLVYYFIKKPFSLFEDKEDYLLLGFLLIIWIAFLFGFFEARSFNHALSYTFAVFVYFIIPKFLIRKYSIHINTILKYVMYCLVLTNGLIVIEWILLNFFDILIRPALITGGPATTNMVFYYHDFFNAVGGVGEEPGGTASLINIFFPLGLIYLYNNNSKRSHILFYVLLHFAALLFLASAAGIVFLFLSYVLVSLYQVKNLVRYAKWMTGIFVFISILYITNIGSSQKFFDRYYKYIEEKVTLSNSNVSANDRKFVWTFALKDWSLSPLIGNGPGYGVETHKFGYFNIFLTILADTGIFSFVIFNLYLIILLIKMNKIEKNYRFFIIISMGCLLLHSSIYYVYYHGPFWIPLILIQLLYKQMLTENQNGENHVLVEQ